MRYTQQELDDVAQAGAIAGLTPSGYAAEVALAAARGLHAPSLEPWRAVLAELMQARAQVRRIGVNLNQAAAVLIATGQPPVWLERALELANRAVVRVDEASEPVARLADRSRRTS